MRFKSPTPRLELVWPRVVTNTLMLQVATSGPMAVSVSSALGLTRGRIRYYFDCESCGVDCPCARNEMVAREPVYVSQSAGHSRTCHDRPCDRLTLSIPRSLLTKLSMYHDGRTQVIILTKKESAPRHNVPVAPPRISLTSLSARTWTFVACP